MAAAESLIASKSGRRRQKVTKRSFNSAVGPLKKSRKLGKNQQGVAAGLAELLVARFQRSVSDLSSTSIERALSAPDQIGFLAELLKATPANDPADERLKEQQVNAARFKRELAQEAGGLLDLADVMVLLGHGTRQAVYKAVREHRLLAVEDGDRLRFPACQFLDGKPIGGLRDLLEVTPEIPGWRVLQYLLVAEEGLADRSPLALLRTGKPEDRDTAVRFARRLTD